MTPTEAITLLAECKALWPAMQLPDQAVKAWAFELLGEEAIDAKTAIHDLARYQARPPALAELLDACEESKRLRVQTTMLPAGRPTTTNTVGFLDWYGSQPVEMQERARKVFPSLFRETA